MHYALAIFNTTGFRSPVTHAVAAGSASQVNALFITQRVGAVGNVADTGGELPGMVFDGAPAGRSRTPANFPIMLAKPVAKVVCDAHICAFAVGNEVTDVHPLTCTVCVYFFYFFIETIIKI